MPISWDLRVVVRQFRSQNLKPVPEQWRSPAIASARAESADQGRSPNHGCLCGNSIRHRRSGDGRSVQPSLSGRITTRGAPGSRVTCFSPRERLRRPHRARRAHAYYSSPSPGPRGRECRGGSEETRARRARSHVSRARAAPLSFSGRTTTRGSPRAREAPPLPAGEPIRLAESRASRPLARSSCSPSGTDK